MKLDISHITKTYSNGVAALRDISLSIPRGLFGLLGPNGAGKSTLMSTIATLQDPDSGTIHFDGVDVRADRQALRRRLGFLPQDFGVYPKLSAVEILDYLARLKGVSDRRERGRRVMELLERVNLTEAAHRAVETFSGGMRQRFGVAQALIGRPDLLILDEPTAGLDPAERNRLHRILSDLGEDKVIILSTHFVGDVANLCSHMAIQNRGQILAAGAPDALLARVRGKIWEKLFDFGARPGPMDGQVISSRVRQRQLQVVVHAERMPAPGFVPKEPDLEDFYHTMIPEQAWAE